MLKLGTWVEYEKQTGRIVGRTFEGQPKYDVMLADGSVRPNVREGDLATLPHMEPDLRSEDLGTGDRPAKSMDHEQTAHERTAGEARNADFDR
jgi:hypothetical protein